MQPPPAPNISFEPSRVVQNGWSEPIFIVEFQGVFYLTKVVWPYDPAIANAEGGDKQDAFDTIKNLFDTNPKLQAVHVTEAEVNGLTHGFTD